MNKIKLFLDRNAPTILTCIAGVGVISTAILAVKATPKALDILNKAEDDKGEELTTLEVIKAAGPVYLPAILTGVSTIVCIFGANALNKRQQAALTSAYILLENSYKGYRSKVKELYGDDVDKHVIEEMVKDRYEEDPTIDEDGQVLFYDTLMGCYFRSNVEKVVTDDGLECYVLS